MAVKPKGIPIGNLTSQLFANIYLNQFDQFVKYQLRIQHYARYTDDFVVASGDKKYLESLLDPIQQFLKNRLQLDLHPQKVCIRNSTQGIDFLGYVILPQYRRLRTKTKHRLFRKLNHRVQQYRNGELNEHTLSQSLNSYLGVLAHADTYHVSQDLKNHYWYWLHE